jgi:hypothetical protein
MFFELRGRSFVHPLCAESTPSALSAVRGRWSCCVQSPRRCAFVGPTGGRRRELLLDIMDLKMITGKWLCQVSVQVLRGGYAFDPGSTGAASSSEGKLALGNGGNPASEQAAVGPNSGKDCRLPSRVLDLQNCSRRGVDVSSALSPSLSP